MSNSTYHKRGKKTYHKRGKKIDGYGASKHPSYGVWAGMKSRCNNKKEVCYPDYGGRGITYCAEWEHFENFARDMGIRPTPDHSIERIDNDKGYCKENCKWATRHEQSLNRRTFKNNTSGYRGVRVEPNGRYCVRVNFKKRCYKLGGTFATAEQAFAAWCELLACLKQGVDVSHKLERPARFDSSTGIRGITRNKDGGYIVRVTLAGKRKYLGRYKNLNDAKEVLQQWKAQNK